MSNFIVNGARRSWPEVLRALVAVCMAAMTALVFFETRYDGLAMTARANAEAIEACKPAIGKMIDLDTRVTVIESNRFTSGDGVELMQMIADLRTDLATLPREVPPAWFLQRVDRLESRLDRIETRLSGIENRIP